MNQSTRLNTNRIMRLDEITASKIAAGEVVEKPAMVEIGRASCRERV